MKKLLNPSVIFYITIIVAIILLISFASGGKVENKNIGISSSTNETITMNENKQVVTMETSLGNIDLELYSAKAPKTVENFLKLAKTGFYDNTKFHRVIKDFMIQGGDPYTKGEDTSVYGTGGPGYAFADEINDLPMVRGMLAMANSGPNTNGSQFFIITASSTPWLIGHHTVFGKVISGMDTVDKIENSKVNGDDLPMTPVVVEKIIIK
jgi:cyclophilin family peptidyl-prolyl cis-trans isomerase